MLEYFFGLCFFISISLLIFIEVIELKCCGLNKNTRRKILNRVEIDDKYLNNFLEGEEDEEEIYRNESQIVLDDQYIVEMKEK